MTAFRQLLSKALRLFWNSGAGDESRTRDLNLGKVALYQLSYSRVKRVRIIKTWRAVSRKLTIFVLAGEMRPCHAHVVEHRPQCQDGGDIDEPGAGQPDVQAAIRFVI